MPVMNGYNATKRIRSMDREDVKEICSSIPASFALILSSVNAFAVIAMIGISLSSSLSIERNHICDPGSV